MKVIAVIILIFLYNIILVFGTKTCPTLVLKNGSVKYRSKGRIARFRCNRGFTLDGDNYGACIRGEWDVDIPRCVFRSRCSAITEIQNGHVLANKQWTSLRFVCNSGYHLIGHPQIQCKNSAWNAEPPKCRTNVQLSCDYENNGICGWDNSTKSGYFWLKRQYATPSHYLQTGPGHDHTLHPKNNGHYLYIETSGLYGRDLKTTIARLYSPLFPPVENNSTCFTFWYHMFGSTIGELIVYIDGHKVFHKTGNQGNRWIKGTINNLPMDTFFQISIEGVPGNGWTGDIAIDDLNITTGAECAMGNLEDTTCDGRCYEDEAQNSTLCLCNQKCIASSTCCSDFFEVCNADTSTTGLPFSSLFTEEGTSVITSEEPNESTSFDIFSSGYDLTNTVDQFSSFSLNSATESTTDGTTEFTSIINTVSEVVVSEYLSTLRYSVSETETDESTHSTVSTHINEDMFTDVHHTDSDQSTVKENLHLYSEIPANIFTSDLALDYSEPEDETVVKKTNIELTGEMMSNETSYKVKDHTSVAVTFTHYSPQQMDNTFTMPVAENISGKQTNIPWLTSVTTTLAPHTHLLKNISLSQTTKHSLTSETLETVQSPTIINVTSFLTETTVKNISLDTNTRPPPITDTAPTVSFVPMTRTERSKWKSKYQPKGYYTYSAMKQEHSNTGTRSIGIILGLAVILVIAAAAGLYIYRRKNFINAGGNDVEEADVLFIPTDEMLDFSLSRPRPNQCRMDNVNKVIL